MKSYSSKFMIVVIALLLTTIAPFPFFSTNLYAADMPSTNDFGLMVDVQGLEDLGPGWAYEGWLIVDDKPVSTGTFTVDATGAFKDFFAVHPATRNAATAFVLTIEPMPDNDPAPSDVHILGGDFTDGTSQLTLDHPAAVGTDFSSAEGSYILGIGYPAGATEENSYVNGIWYLNSLDLPALPAGWAYEGWVVGDDGPISTGRFTDPNGMDEDGSGPAAGGPGTGPNFPGQDFLDPAVNLIGYAAVISVEPVPDNSPAPFFLKPLVDAEIEDVGDHGSQSMTNQAAASAATGSATFIERMAVSVDGLEDLGAGWAYEGWLIVDGQPVSAGIFTIDAQGTMSEDVFMVSSYARANATDYILTLEPSPDSNPAPSAVHVMGGSFAGGVANLSVAHPGALGNDFAAISGSYILAAPSGGPLQPYANGIWWLDPAGPSPSLDLPELPMGWIYEGWVVGADGPISTGSFSALDAPDSDGGGSTAGPLGVPPYPGQDFVNPAIDLTSGYAAVISIEPVPDNSPAPFAYKPLVDGNIDDVGGMTLQPMATNLDSLATGLVSFMDTVHWDIQGLEPLGAGWVYEGWLIVDGAPVSTGLFDVDSNGHVDMDMAVISSAQHQAATAFVLTIEPSPDNDPAPSDVHILGGDIEDGVASLSIGHPAALGTDFTDAAGSYILGIGYPAGATAENSYVNGIWYLDSLDLPTLPAGWVYEGWVVGEDGPISTGRFTDANGMDSDGSGPAAGGPGTGPNGPGQDFLDPALDLIGYAAVISVEPSPDDSELPFVLKPLVDAEIEDVGDHGSQSMANNAVNSSPTGTVHLSSGVLGAHSRADGMMNGSMEESTDSMGGESMDDGSMDDGSMSSESMDGESMDDGSMSSESMGSESMSESMDGESMGSESMDGGSMISGPRVVVQGELSPAATSYEGSGMISLVQDGDTYYLQFDSLVSSTGPELRVLLVENPGGQNLASLGNYVDLGPLQEKAGTQVYAISDPTDVANYNGVVIYSNTLQVIFSAAEF